MKLGWSGFRSAFAFAIIAVTSAAEANSFGGAGGFWAVSCRAIAAVITRVRIVQRTRRRIRPPVRRRLYSIRVSPARAQRCRLCATDVIGLEPFDRGCGSLTGSGEPREASQRLDCETSRAGDV